MVKFGVGIDVEVEDIIGLMRELMRRFRRKKQ
jgi:hypothetical protein